MKSSPAATKASSTSKERASSAVHPKTLPPSANGPISRPDFPNARLAIGMAFPPSGRRQLEHALGVQVEDLFLVGIADRCVVQPLGGLDRFLIRIVDGPHD